jgi:copper chaperone CopZ
MKKVDLKVYGMSCTGCENSIKRVLSKLLGVNEVIADSKIMKVEIEFDDSRLSLDTIIQKIEDLGFKVVQ